MLITNHVFRKPLKEYMATLIIPILCNIHITQLLMMPNKPQSYVVGLALQSICMLSDTTENQRIDCFYQTRHLPIYLT